MGTRGSTPLITLDNGATHPTTIIGPALVPFSVGGFRTRMCCRLSTAGTGAGRYMGCEILQPKTALAIVLVQGLGMVWSGSAELQRGMAPRAPPTRRSRISPTAADCAHRNTGCVVYIMFRRRKYRDGIQFLPNRLS